MSSNPDLGEPSWSQIIYVLAGVVLVFTTIRLVYVECCMSSAHGYEPIGGPSGGAGSIQLINQPSITTTEVQKQKKGGGGGGKGDLEAGGGGKQSPTKKTKK
jgi:hypothetical protein